MRDRRNDSRSRARRGVLAAGLASLLLGGLATSAASEADSCREWQQEHRGWAAQVVSRYLGGAAEREVEEAVFELLQREAYLTSCQQPLARARAEMVGWRLVGRAPEEYGSAVLESLLERAGFDVGLRGLFPDVPQLAARRPPAPGRPRIGAGAR